MCGGACFPAQADKKKILAVIEQLDGGTQEFEHVVRQDVTAAVRAATGNFERVAEAPAGATVAEQDAAALNVPQRLSKEGSRDMRGRLSKVGCHGGSYSANGSFLL